MFVVCSHVCMEALMNKTRQKQEDMADVKQVQSGR